MANETSGQSGFLVSWLGRSWTDYRERMQHVGRTGWASRIAFQRAEVRRVVGHIRTARSAP